jgi:hypothetical protein
MTRPLKILKGLVEEDPTVTRDKINKLLGEAIVVSEESLRQLSGCLRHLLNKNQASKTDQGIFDLGVRFYNDIKAANFLISEGFILQTLMMQRDAIETRVLMEYLHEYPQDVEAWQKAQSFKERYRFSINNIQDKVTGGGKWKDIWNDWSAFIHPNDSARPIYSGIRPFFGYNLYLGGFYAPETIAVFFSIQLAICIDFLESFTVWYKDDLSLPSELTRKVKTLNRQYHVQINKLMSRANSAQKEIDESIKTTRLSHKEKIKLFKFLDTLP